MNGVKYRRRRARLCAIALLALTACRPQPPDPGTLVVALAAEPQSLDPRFGLDAASSRIADLLHAGLTRADPQAGRMPDLARAWEHLDDRTVAFDLYPDARFADGTPVTASDVQATYEAVRDPAVGSPRRAGLTALVAVETPTPHRVVMRLTHPDPTFLDTTGLAIMPAHMARAHAVPTGAGPFRLVEVVPGERIVLEANPHHRDGPPAIARVVVRIVPDPLIRLLELRRGSIHLLQEFLEPELLAWTSRLPGIRVRQRPGSSFAYLGLNLRDPRLAQRRVRRALALALDRDALIRTVLGGAARAATGLLPPEHWAHAELPAPVPQPERARRLLDRAGFPDPDGPGPQPRFRVLYKASNDPARRRLAEAMQAQLASVGIQLDIRTYEWGTLFADVRTGNFSMVAMVWVGVTEPDHLYRTFHSSMTPPAGYNRGFYRDPVIDRLVTAARRTLDRSERRRLYARVQARLARELPVIPLWWEDRIVVHTAALRGFEPHPSGDLRGLARATLE